MIKANLKSRSSNLAGWESRIPNVGDKIILNISGKSIECDLCAYNTKPNGSIRDRYTLGEQVDLVLDLMNRTMDHPDSVLRKSSISIDGHEVSLNQFLWEGRAATRGSNLVAHVISSLGHGKNTTGAAEAIEANWLMTISHSGMEALYLQLDNPEYLAKLSEYSTSPHNLIHYSHSSQTGATTLGPTKMLVLGKECIKPQDALISGYLLDFLNNGYQSKKNENHQKTTGTNISVEEFSIGTAVLSSLKMLDTFKCQIKGRQWVSELITEQDYSAILDAKDKIESIEVDSEYYHAVKEMCVSIGKKYTSNSNENSTGSFSP